MRRRRFALMMVLAALMTSAAHAVTPGEILKDPALETRARNLSQELRCMVCQNQSIDDSEAPLARDLRILVRERLQAGDSDHQVLDYLVTRYGDFVLLRPRFTMHTVLLWALPPLVLIAGIFGLWAARRRRVLSGTEPNKLSAAEQRRIASLVEPGAD